MPQITGAAARVHRLTIANVRSFVGFESHQATGKTVYTNRQSIVVTLMQQEDHDRNLNSKTSHPTLHPTHLTWFECFSDSLSFVRQRTYDFRIAHKTCGKAFAVRFRVPAFAYVELKVRSRRRCVRRTLNKLSHGK